jgi:hypothetical protein
VLLQATTAVCDAVIAATVDKDVACSGAVRQQNGKTSRDTTNLQL